MKRYLSLVGLLAVAIAFNQSAFARYLQSDPIGLTRDYSGPQLQAARQMGVIRTPNIGRTLYPLNHLYIYANNNPLRYIDPLGLDWIYQQSTGHLYYQSYTSADGGPPSLVSPNGYSGKGMGKNNPSYQNVPNVGPIPQGTWTIGTPYNSNRVGPFAIPLTPNQGTNTFGRTDFRIHGDNSCMCGTASEGCIILGRNIRNQIMNSGDPTLRVIP